MTLRTITVGTCVGCNSIESVRKLNCSHQHCIQCLVNAKLSLYSTTVQCQAIQCQNQQSMKETDFECITEVNDISHTEHQKK